MSNNKGITLIALIITIVVLLILAGVSLNAIVGENGVLNQAQKASEKTNKAKDEEQRQMSIAEATMNFENTEFTDKNGEKVTIPAGFAVSQVEGENTVKDGLVIIDSNRNEFVWIPCNKENVINYKNANNLSQNWPKYSYDLSNNWSNPEQQIQAGISSITNYGGFYIARYEAGVPSNATFYVPSSESSNKIAYMKDEEKNNNNVINLKPVSKKGNQIWNCISQEKAKKISENMYSENNSIKSFLIDSNAWNYICKYILEEKRSINIDDSTSYGNYFNSNKSMYSGIIGLYAMHTNDGKIWETSSKYSYGTIPEEVAPQGKGSNRIELSTGISEKFKAYNIYDMAGNMWEWTAESTEDNSNNVYVVLRGGSFDNNGDKDSITASGGHHNPEDFDFHIGFRSVLYLK